jgi:hypothetical protein
MRLTIITVVLTALLAGFTGCNSSPEPIAPPVSPEQLTQMRDTYRRTDPEARVGVVTAVLAGSNLASVGGVPVKDFTVGDVITFLDSNGKTLTMGLVEAINKNTLTVHYDNPTDKHGRAPVEGDIAVRAIH